MDVPHALPRLPRCLPKKGAEGRAAALLRLLRRIALAKQTAQPQTFYSLRTVADAFDLPLSLVDRAFRHLEEEGLLGRIRSSRTVLHGCDYDRHLHVRGVVGMPVSVFRFSAFADYRTLITQIRRRLRRHGFMPAEVFLDQNEARGAFLAEHLLEAKADSVVWVFPNREGKETVEVLQDAGVRIVGVGDSVVTPIRCRYEVRKENALRAILRDWLTGGLTSTLVVRGPRSRSVFEEEKYSSTSEDEGLSSESISVGGERLSKRGLASITGEAAQGIILTGSAAAFFALREPEVLWELMQKRRVALVDGPLNLLFAKIPDVPVDLISVDWSEVAVRIVNDLVTQAAWDKSKSVSFDAKSHLAVPVKSHCLQM